MSEKTSEEKLREELERDSLMRDNPRSPSENKAKSSSSMVRGVRHRVSSGTDKSIGKRVDSFVDSFIDDFEKKIEDSLSGVSVRTSSPHSKQEKPRIARKTESEKQPSKAAPKEEHVKPKAEVHENLPLISREPDATAKTIHDTSEKSSHIEDISAHDDIEQPVMIAAGDVQQVMPEDKPVIDEHSDVAHETEQPLTIESAGDVQQVMPENKAVIDEHSNITHETEQPLTIESAGDVQQVMPEDKPVIDQHSDISHDTEQPVMIEAVNDAPQVMSEDKPVIDEHSDIIHETEQPVMIEAVDEIPQIIPEVEPVTDMPADIPEVEPATDMPSDILEVEPVTDMPSDVPEESKQEAEHEPEIISEPEDEELPDIPLINAEEYEEEDEELPDIPVISADEVEDPSEEEELEEFADIPIIDAESEAEPESEDKPDEHTEREESDEPEEDITDDNMPADIVLNVDSDLPQITNEPNEPEEEEPDPESESAPVTVTMPETIKTAEDKLMADIAEAFTGNPLTLESKESPEPYRLPEDFFKAQGNDSNSEQSAEDKLKANIAQAISESPIGIAQQQAMQDLEQDLNPFDDISLSELAEMTPQRNTESDIEAESEHEEHEEAFLPDFTDEEENVITTDPEDFHDISEPDADHEENEEDSGPFDVEFHDEHDEYEQDLNLNELPLSDDVPDDEPLVESDSELEVMNLNEPVELKKHEPKPEPEPESEPLTAQQRLEQEIAQFTQDAPEENENEKENINESIDTKQEEVSPENDMPDTLLDGTENDIAPQDDDDIGDDWDINSLGIISEAASIPDDEPEPESEPDFTNEPELEPELDFMTGVTEETHKEKTMGLREKLAAKKNGTSPKDSSAPAKKTSSSSLSSFSGGGGILLPLLLFLLLAVGALTLWQLYSLPDRLASVLAMNSGGGSAGVFDSISGTESTPSYDYAIDFILDPDIVERMSQRGREGWQVVGSRRTQDSTTGQYGYEIIFMKRIPGR